VSVKIEGYSVLRLYSPDSDLAPSDLEGSFSEGSGLNAPAQLLPADDQRSLCVSPQSPKPVLLQLSRQAYHATPIDVALFISRVDFEGRLTGYHDLIPLPGAEVRLSHSRLSCGETWWRVPSWRPISLPTDGPARLALMSRLEYLPGESSSLQAYQVFVSLDGKRHCFVMETDADTSTAFWIGSSQVTLGRERIGYLEVPDGQHWLEIESTAPLYP
jgi:hypothetical protein